MSHEIENRNSISKPGWKTLGDNPLYIYLLDLQNKRLNLVETLAPQRHTAWQLWVFVSFLLLWITGLIYPLISELPIFLLTILGPLAIAAGTVYAGWNVQMLAVSNYPSPLDSPRALELLFSTPLTEKEIVDATVLAYARFPFLNFTPGRLGLVILNLITLGLILTAANERGMLRWDVFLMTIDLYAPAVCVFIFSPILTALDILYVPRSLLLRRSESESQLVSGQSGRMLMIAVFLVLAPIMAAVSMMDPTDPVTTRWVLMIGCPITVITVGFVAFCFYLFAPNYLKKIRRL